MNGKPKPIAIYGAGGFGLEVAMLIEQINDVSPSWKILGFFDDGETKGKIINDYPVLGGIDELNHWQSQLNVVLALGIPDTKINVFNKIENKFICYPVLIHPSVIMGNTKYVHIREGSIICAGTMITTNISIGRHVIINLACTIGHQAEIGEFSSFMPSCNVSGEVKIGAGTFWGTSSKVINKKTVGNHVTVGAGAVVIDDLPDHVTAVGVPAKVIKRGEKVVAQRKKQTHLFHPLPAVARGARSHTL